MNHEHNRLRRFLVRVLLRAEEMSGVNDSGGITQQLGIIRRYRK